MLLLNYRFTAEAAENAEKILRNGLLNPPPFAHPSYGFGLNLCGLCALAVKE